MSAQAQKNSPIIKTGTGFAELIGFIAEAAADLDNAQKQNPFSAPEAVRSWIAYYELMTAVQLLDKGKIRTYDLGFEFQRKNAGIFDPQNFQIALSKLWLTMKKYQ